jgi:hypothetical protein
MQGTQKISRFPIQAVLNGFKCLHQAKPLITSRTWLLLGIHEEIFSRWKLPSDMSCRVGAFQFFLNDAARS